MNATPKGVQGKFFILLLILLFLQIALVHALEISNVQAEDITPTSAVITWTTDEPANSFISYGVDKSNVQTLGDANLLTEHQLLVSSLALETVYYYKVRSADIENDNSGNFYSFTTLPADTSAPELSVELPEILQGERIDIAGKTEDGAIVTLYVNGVSRGQTTAHQVAKESGEFIFSNVLLQSGVENQIKIEALDASSNQAEFNGVIVADNSRPKVTLESLPAVVTNNRLTIKGTVSESSTLEISLNDISLAKVEGTEFTKDLVLKEGKNNIIISAKDAAGWETSVGVEVEADTVPPQVEFELVSGTEYYENRAETDITGKTKPGSNMYLYIFRIGTTEYQADFSQAIANVTADAQGNFIFSEVSFPPPVFSQLSALAPREVPSGLQHLLISPLSQLQDAQRKGYRVFIIAEDRMGRTNFKERTVNVNSCSSGNFAFDILPITQFQAPFRLDPGLMEDGRENIQAVFNLSYRGSSLGLTNPATGEVELPYTISNIEVYKACTQDTAEKEDYALGCKLLPSRPLKVQRNNDGSAFYITSSLMRTSDFLKKNEDPWKDFQKRQLKLPLKIVVKYSEKETAAPGSSTESWSSVKVQSYCYDLGYFVDVPINSSDLVPEFLINEGVSGLNATINLIEQVKPYLKIAMVSTGIGCVGSFLVKMGLKAYRMLISNFEPWAPAGESDSCPKPPEQYTFPLQETIDSWNKLSAEYGSLPPESSLPANLESLEEKCPMTADAWKVESYLDQSYRWTCDRFFCREVPAGWTASKEKSEVDKVIQDQKQCTATSMGIYLKKIENCQKYMKENFANANIIPTEITAPECYSDSEGTKYYVDAHNQGLTSKDIWKLTPFPGIGAVGVRNDELLAYKPQGAETMLVGIDESCTNFCKRMGGYQEAKDGFAHTDTTNGDGCYKETSQTGVVGFLSSSDIELTGSNGATVSGTKVASGMYTRDCFIGESDGQRYQCVCDKTDGKATGSAEIIKRETNRQALKESSTGLSTVSEEWSYEQDRVYQETGGLYGTYYPKWRYYAGRDFSGAFGLDYALDNFREGKTTTTINPHTQTWSTWQTLCLPGINAQLEQLQSLLSGFRSCIIEAKYTGFHDAGMCKTLFSQYMCGFFYKVLTLATDKCSPLTFNDLFKGVSDPTEGGLSAFLDAGLQAVPNAISSSITEVQSDYKNAELQNLFSLGTQGFAQSMCMAALGYDFPMGMDFIMDSAYSFPIKTNVMVPLATRELSTFNPVKGTATYNYEIAGSVIPGCKIRGYRTYLKCVGPGDLNHPNVECQGNGCDCLQARNADAILESEKVYYGLEGGSSFTSLQKNQLFDLPLPSPQKVSSNFRYDHVVIELTLEQGEKPDSCFDEGYRTSNGGIYYFPITELNIPSSVSCYVDGTSGRFVCPEIGSLFSGGTTYFEHPYMQCFDKKTDTFVDCTTPNLFLLGDPVIIKPYMYLGKETACLRITGEGLTPINTPLTEGSLGPYAPRINVATVNENMLHATGEAGLATAPNSDIGCNVEVKYRPLGQSITPMSLRFSYTTNGGLYYLNIPPGVGLTATSVSAGYSIGGNNVLMKGNNNLLSLEEINAVEFTASGFTFAKVLGTSSPGPAGGSCTYQLSAGRGSSAAVGSLTVRAELLKPGQNENCFTAAQKFPRSALGKPEIIQSIRVQAEAMEATVAKSMHPDFMAGNYGLVQAKALEIMRSGDVSITDAMARYYLISSIVMVNKDTLARASSQIKPYLDGFFAAYGQNNVPAESTIDGPEVRKMRVYLCEIGAKLTPPQNYCI